MKTALVTGAGGAIGAAALCAFDQKDFDVVGIDREQADLTQADEVEAALSPLDRLDAVFTAHGITGRALGDGPVDVCTEDAWDAVLAANLRSVFLVCKHAVPKLRAAGGGAIVTLSSVLGLVGNEDFATHAYAASKGGLISLTRAMAAAYAKEGIRCNVICPGLIETPMSRRAQDDPGIVARLPELQPLTGELGRPEDVAEAAVYLATAPFVTGAVLTVDGGWTAR